MGAEHKGIRRRRIREEPASIRAGHFGIEVSPCRPVRMAALDRVVQDITGGVASHGHRHDRADRLAKPHSRAGEYDGIEYSGLPIKPTHVRYHQTHQGISDTPELPTIHQVPGAPMML